MKVLPLFYYNLLYIPEHPLKGTVSLTSSDLPFVDWYVDFLDILIYKAEINVPRNRVHYSKESTVYTVTSSLPVLNLQLYE